MWMDGSVRVRVRVRVRAAGDGGHGRQGAGGRRPAGLYPLLSLLAALNVVVADRRSIYSNQYE